MMAHSSEILFVEIYEIHDIEYQKSGTQHHSLLRIGERYHEPVRRAFQKFGKDHPKLNTEFLLRHAVKACNDTLRPEDVIPSA